jgi:hypothetical protein
LQYPSILGEIEHATLAREFTLVWLDQTIDSYCILFRHGFIKNSDYQRTLIIKEKEKTMAVYLSEHRPHLLYPLLFAILELCYSGNNVQQSYQTNNSRLPTMMDTKHIRIIR